MLLFAIALLHYAPARAETPQAAAPKTTQGLPTVAPHISADARFKPKPGPKRGGIDTQVKAGAPKTIVIQPRATAPATAQFHLLQTRSGLILRFESKDPNLYFASEKPFVVQLISHAPLQLTPSLVTNSNWPKNGQEVAIQYKGALPNSKNKIQGAASFWLCSRQTKPGTKPCKKTKSDFDFEFKP